MKEHPQKKLAQLLFIDQGLDLKEISKMTGVSQNSLTAWNKEGGWKQLQNLRRTAPEQLLARYLEHQGRIMDAADEEERPLNVVELQGIGTLAKAAAGLDKSVNTSIVMSVLKKYLKRVELIDDDVAKFMAGDMMVYVNELIDAEK
jgi:hypothetical protein